MPAVQLKTLSIRSTMPTKKRVFTEDEFNFLKTRSVADLKERQVKGRQIIALLSNPAQMNMTPARSNALVSNLKFQIEAIQQIIDSKEINNG